MTFLENVEHIHFEVLKIIVVASLHIFNLVKVRLILKNNNHETKNNCKRVIEPKKLIDLCRIHKLYAMK